MAAAVRASEDGSGKIQRRKQSASTEALVDPRCRELGSDIPVHLPQANESGCGDPADEEMKCR